VSTLSKAFSKDFLITHNVISVYKSQNFSARNITVINWSSLAQCLDDSRALQTDWRIMESYLVAII